RAPADRARRRDPVPGEKRRRKPRTRRGRKQPFADGLSGRGGVATRWPQPCSGVYSAPMAVSPPELKPSLPGTSFFGGLADASLEILVSMLAECRVEAGATVVTEGEPGRSL